MANRYTSRRAGLAVLLVLVVFGCKSARSGKPVVAPPFELKDLSGQTVRLDSFRGHPVLLDFWATWCGPCQASTPMVETFYARHKADGLVVLGLNMDDDPSNVYAYVKHFGISYPVLLAGSSNIMSDYKMEGIPMFIFIDAQGRIDDVYEGFSPSMPRQWESELQRLLTKVS